MRKYCILYAFLATAAFITGGIAQQTWGLCLGSVTGFIFCGGFLIAAICNLGPILDWDRDKRAEEIKKLPLLLSATIARLDEETYLDMDVYWWKTASRPELIALLESCKRLTISDRLKTLIETDLRILSYPELRENDNV